MGYQLRDLQLYKCWWTQATEDAGTKCPDHTRAAAGPGPAPALATAETVDRSSLHLHSSTLAAAACQHVTGDRDPTNTTVTVALDPNSLVKM